MAYWTPGSKTKANSSAWFRIVSKMVSFLRVNSPSSGPTWIRDSLGLKP